MSDAQQPVFNIEKLYVKDLSVEVPNAPAVYLEREAPQMEVNMSTESRALNEDMYHSSITVTVTAKLGDKTMFLVECTQAGIFRIQNVPQDQMPMVLGIGCPNIVFPYLRETVSDVVIRAGFPPLLLNPVNFEAIFVQQQQAQQQQAGAAQTH
ncbi:protein export chaperone SecB [Thiobacillus denitrificans ATCC 25259]|uniref:Protein-export protein SecB n=1 Tax=Thiobacillus denitrificans (strain ATCC 25259 / T1) TaxID=292415 RepID=SECB_THIDA|nr:protein-export chaperone SecB [Thiobacillus denitrificans]Q3SG95.1 RecName: Full=Protein-export protein SecB [Thiobacillus denitrificans ATCC 25259]AAZ98355.1 protein export chaperone SecB [Thiobacillus denitrificans ATCC 25259]